MNGGVLRAAAPTPLPSLAPLESPVAVHDPQPITFPWDEGPHDRLTEWWYYTGHLESGATGTGAGPGSFAGAATGAAKGTFAGSATPRRYGFEFVVFRAERGNYPVAWASHFAITDPGGGTFRYDQRSEVGPQVDASPPDGGFELTIHPTAQEAQQPTDAPWTMRGRLGRDHLEAGGSPGMLALDLSTDRPPALHDEDGWIDLGPAGGTYYYSRTRMGASGTLALPGGGPMPVDGIAWFDHQWGDFIAVGAGGWDWFAVNLADGTDVTLSLIRGADGTYPLAYGTLVQPDGSARPLRRGDFSVSVASHWTNTASGATYPAGWRIEVPGERLAIDLMPTLADQELDTRSTTGVVYWEGSQVVRAERAGSPIGGEAYVELTGYAR